MSQMYVMFPYELNILEPVSSLQYPRGVNVLVRYTASSVPDHDQPLGEISLSRMDIHDVFSHGLQFYDCVPHTCTNYLGCKIHGSR